MFEFVIESVTKTRPWINGMEAHLDEPVAGTYAQPRLGLTLQGWAACAGSRIVSVRLVSFHSLLARAKLVQRPDVTTAIADKPHNIGFRIDTVPLVLGEREPLSLVVDTEDQRTTAVFEIRVRYAGGQRASAQAEDAMFAPLLASARSGTTLLSSMLHRHPSVLGHNQYPYEARFGVHLAEEWFASSQPRFYEPEGADDRGGMDQNLLAVLEAFDARDAAAHARVGQFLVELRARYRQQIVDLYRMLAPNGRGRAIVEKIGFKRDLDLLSGLFAQVRPMFLVRDPRDMLVSMRAFNERRGIYDFHEVHGKTFDAVLPVMSGNLRHLARLYERWPRDKLLVRYEDMARDPRGALTRILAFLSLEHDAPTLETCLRGRLDSPGVHVTSASAEESIGRWKDVLTQNQAELANWAFEPFLRKFGYPV
jgi:Sulfotransferase family